MRDRPRPGRQPRVDAATSARFKERIVAGAALERDGVVAFRGVDAPRILKEEFEIACSLSSTYRLLHRIKLSWLAPRPRHPEADATAQAEFWQHLDCHWLANSVFSSLADIMDAGEMAWNRFATNHHLIRSLCAVAWAPAAPDL